MDTSKPSNRTSLSIWPPTLLRLNALRSHLGVKRGKTIDLDEMINELIDHHVATTPKKPVRSVEYA